jgi:DNA polymerase V
MPAATSFPLLTASAGFPSPAEDYLDARLDLSAHLIRNPASTYFVRVQGDSMRGAGIATGDLLVVDRSVTPRPGHVVVAAVDGGLTVKRLTRQGRTLALVAENPDYPPIPLNGERAVDIWGVAIHVIRKLTPGGAF